jgi:hypothetical protein
MKPTNLGTIVPCVICIAAFVPTAVSDEYELSEPNLVMPKGYSDED